MQLIKYFALTYMIALASGCAFNRQAVLETAVGPPPLVAASRAPEGGLAVYSARDIGTPGDPEGVSYHSGYWIYAFDGKKVKYVKNRVGTIIEDPATVSLPPGEYKIVAKAAAFGMVTVPILIEAGKTTFVRLDGSELTDGRKGSASDLVRLPDGRIIGWRAKENGDAK